MMTVELFCGTKSFSKVAAQLGHGTFTVDNNPRHAPDLCINILAVEPQQLPTHADILWASPPCEAFSVASIPYHWNIDRTPRSERALVAQRIVEKTLSLINAAAPRWWFIENPRGMLRALPLLAAYPRRTVSYCQYGDMRMKPTDIWTNAGWWRPRPLCRIDADCHEGAPRGARTGTQGLAGATRRARIPHPLFVEIFAQLPQGACRV
jgi:hypothetical protein